MIKRFLTFVSVLTVLQAGVYSQVQKGLVKTRGYIDENGVYVPGKGIPSALVKIKDANEVGSSENGTFEITLPDEKFYLESVLKKGHITQGNKHNGMYTILWKQLWEHL